MAPLERQPYRIQLGGYPFPSIGTLFAGISRLFRSTNQLLILEIRQGEESENV